MEKKWYTASSGRPAGEVYDRLVVVADSREGADRLLADALSVAGLKKDAEDWIWGGAGSQSFDSLDEAQAFADECMGVDA
jgi:hypothetical protein